ncbi:predicted protein [Botrytis cinerea T4]|uniref:Uncharacterized protein n=1 Tax=Botryotinia fuckeliana (strain T4) TaxID=999810 RepID=G2Y022_BOTF4|nr:predicted protein [Botrytis cinerea T4]
MIDSRRIILSSETGSNGNSMFDNISHLPTFSIFPNDYPSPLTISILILRIARLNPNSKGTYELFTSLAAITCTSWLKSEMNCL